MEGVLYNYLMRNEELNKRIADRNVPSESLEPNLGFNPQPTKYTLVPLPRQDKDTTQPPASQSYPVYKPSQVFNPGTARAPWSGYACAVDTESVLKNQFFAASKSPQATFIPGSKSDLYTATLPKTSPLLTRHPFLHQLPFSDYEARRERRPVVDALFNADSSTDRMVL